MKLNELTLLAAGANSRLYSYGQGHQQVVLKTVPATSPKEQKHLKNQFQLLQSLHHRHVIKSLRYRQNVAFLGNKTDKQLKPSPTSNILILQYASKSTLLHFLKQKPDINSKRRAFRHISLGLAYLHSQGIAHRDLKLQNILVFPLQDGQLLFKISDLGLASKFKQGEKTLKFKEFKGTRKGYMAPEIHECLKDRSKQYDAAKTDIFALGVILFALVFETLPFQYALATDCYYKRVMQKQFTSFWNCHQAKLQLEMDVRLEEMKTLFQKMVSSNPQQRPDIQDVLKSTWLLQPLSAPS